MIQEYETVELNTNLPQYGLHQGARGTVVMIHHGGEGYEVEFFDEDGDTVAIRPKGVTRFARIATCLADQIRS